MQLLLTNTLNCDSIGQELIVHTHVIKTSIHTDICASSDIHTDAPNDICIDAHTSKEICTIYNYLHFYTLVNVLLASVACQLYIYIWCYIFVRMLEVIGIQWAEDIVAIKSSSLMVQPKDKDRLHSNI